MNYYMQNALNSACHIVREQYIYNCVCVCVCVYIYIYKIINCDIVFGNTGSLGDCSPAVLFKN